MRRAILLLCLALLVSCGQGQADPQPTATPAYGELPAAIGAAAEPGGEVTSAPAVVELAISDKDISFRPLPIRAGMPFTLTAVIHNLSPITVTAVPLLVYISEVPGQFGFSPFLTVVTATVPPTHSLPVEVPVRWNLPGGEHELWVRVNSLPPAWQDQFTLLPEARLADNAVSLGLAVQPFDAYASDLCAGRVDVGLEAGGVWCEADLHQVHVRVQNLGNQAGYNLPVIVTAGQATGLAYTPALPPCGGTVTVIVSLDHALKPGEPFRVQVNPEGWPDGLAEDDFGNNELEATAGLQPEPGQTGAPVTDYDFAVSEADVDLSQAGIVVLTVHNLGTRDAAQVPVRIEGRAGRKILDTLTLVKGGGLGVVAVSLGQVSGSGVTLTITVNPPDAKGAYAESQRDNNVVTILLPKK